MANNDRALENLHHSVCEQSEVSHAHEELLPRLRAAARGEEIPNHWYSNNISKEELFKNAARSVNNLIVIIMRLTQDMYCDNCGNTGGVMERMGGCRDDNEMVICPKCHGRYPTKKESHAKKT